MQNIKTILLALMLAIAGFKADAAISVQAKLDSAYLEMGRITTLHLKVTQPKDAKGYLPLQRELRENGIYPLCGDSIELRAPSKIDTVERGSSLIIDYEIPLQAFDSGYYRLPEIPFVIGNDTARSKSLKLKVIPVKAEANTPIHDYASTAQPEKSSIFDHLPDWIYYYWWLILIILAAIAAFVYVMRRYRREGHLLPQKPAPTPYEIAIESLRNLKDKKLWEQGMEKEYYTDLTEILRIYLEGRFGINAMEMTSRQILHALSDYPEIRDRKNEVRQILDMADFVKFAKVRPLPDDNVKAYDNAWQFVRDTKPVPLEQENEKGGKI